MLSERENNSKSKDGNFTESYFLLLVDAPCIMYELLFVVMPVHDVHEAITVKTKALN